MADVILHFKDGHRVVIHKDHAIPEAMKMKSDIARWISQNDTLCIAMQGEVLTVEAEDIAEVEVRVKTAPQPPAIGQ